MLFTFVSASALLYQLMSTLLVSGAPSSQNYALQSETPTPHDPLQPLHDGHLSSYLNKPNQLSDAYASWTPNSGYSMWEVSGAKQGDILEDDLESEEDKDLPDLPQNLWPGGVVPYHVNQSHYDEQQLSMILQGMAEIESKTCVTFRPLQEGDTSWVEVDRRYGDGCYSYVGRQRGGQLIHLALECFPVGIYPIVHEFLHALGLYHMQSAPYRDYYIRLNIANIPAYYLDQFEKEEFWKEWGQGYDYESIMHYSPKMASGNGRDTMTPRIPGVRLHVNTELSAKDILTLNIMYQCFTTPKESEV